jgi:membrane protein
MRQLGRAVGHAGALFERGISEFFADGCGQRAAAISYYALLSLFPLAILAVAVFGVVANDEQARARVIDFVLAHVPLQKQSGSEQLHSLLVRVTGQAGGFGGVGIVGLLLAASGVMGSIRHALNAAWDVPEHRPPAQGKLVDIALVLGFALVIAASIGLTVLGRVVDSTLQALVSHGVSVLMLFVMVSVMFLFLPSRDTRLRDIWPGALFAAVGFEVAKTLFDLYLQTVANYGVVYGSLGTVIALLAFLYIAACVFLLGAEMASEWPAVRARPTGGPSTTPFGTKVWRLVRGLFVRTQN